MQKTLLEKKNQLGRGIIMEIIFPFKTILQMSYLPTSEIPSPKDYLRNLIGELGRGNSNNKIRFDCVN